MRTAVVISHPIQHFCPQYVSFAENRQVAFKVFFASALGYKKYYDPSFEKEIFWSNIHLDKFNHEFVNGEEVIMVDKNIDAPGIEMHLTAYAPDLVILYGYFQKLQRRTHAWAKRNKVKTAYISDSELVHDRNSLKEFLKGIYLRKYFSSISYFLSVGDANEQFYKHYGVKDDKIIRMHFPIDILLYRKQYQNKEMLRKEVRAKHGIGEKEFVLVVAGKLVPWKNQDHIIEAMKLLETEGKHMHLLLLGSGEMMENWKLKAAALNESRAHFVGFVNIEDLPAYYAAADIYVHPASIEPHSIAISEAIYMGCPVIISDKCGSYGESDDVQPGRNGFVFSFGNIPVLAEKIRLLYTDEILRKQFGEYSHQIAVQFQERAHRAVLNDLLNK